MTINVLIRADASHDIGTGHIMRCITLAKALKKQSVDVTFVSRHLPENLQDSLESEGFTVKLLSYSLDQNIDELQHAHWLGASQLQDAQATAEIITNEIFDWVVTDSYALDYRWHQAIRPYTKKIMVIDDIADRKHDCDLLLDQNYYLDMESRYTDKVPADCQLLTGPKYALLREEFSELRKFATIRSGDVKQILVNFGGIDPENYTAKVIKALANINKYKFDVDVVIGTQHPQKNQIQQLCSQLGYELHIQTNKMAELMLEADLAIGAGGSTTWERCCLGLPSITIPIAENQEELVINIAEVGVIYYPKIKGDFKSEIETHINALLGNPSLRKNISFVALNFVRANGVKDVASCLLKNEISLKKTSINDLEKLFLWRNHIDIRNVSKNKNKIDFESHKIWFMKVLNDPSKHIFIAYDSIENEDLGVLRFDIVNKVAEISVYLNPEKTHPSGLGTKILKSGENWLLENTDIEIIKAIVLSENKISKKFFEKNNYTEEHSAYIKKVRH